MTVRYDLWLGFVKQKVGIMTELEQDLAEATAACLRQTEEKDRDDGYEARCVGAMVAIIELTRSVKSGQAFQVIRA